MPILALTATASPTRRMEIVKLLSMKKTTEIIVNCDRPNIIYSCLKSNNSDSCMRSCFDWMIKMLKSDKEQSPKCIIYCRNIPVVGRVYDMIMREMGKEGYIGDESFHNCLVAMFHRSSIQRNKEHVLKNFPKNNSITRIVVATSAFGMGINIPDVRYVLHWGTPRTMESFFQESGRGGRDGLQSNSVIYYHPINLRVKMTDKELIQYCKDDNMCRRKRLISYFTPSIEMIPSTCPHLCCDVCCVNCKCGQCPINIATASATSMATSEIDTSEMEDNDTVDMDDDVFD